MNLLTGAIEDSVAKQKVVGLQMEEVEEAIASKFITSQLAVDE